MPKRHEAVGISHSQQSRFLQIGSQFNGIALVMMDE